MGTLHAQECLQTMKGELVKEEQQSAGLQRSRTAFLAVWRRNRMRSGAARLIQRHFRARRLHKLLARTQLNAKVRLSCLGNFQAPSGALRLIVLFWSTATPIVCLLALLASSCSRTSHKQTSDLASIWW